MCYLSHDGKRHEHTMVLSDDSGRGGCDSANTNLLARYLNAVLVWCLEFDR